MPATLEQTKVYALALLAGALVLLALGTAGLEGRLLSLAKANPATQLQRDAAVDRYAPLFAAEPFAGLLRSANRRDVFTTSHFNKPPVTPVEPEKPKTRLASLTYLGTLRTSGGETSAFVRVDQNVLKLPVGAKVIQDWTVATMTGSLLVLTNGVQTNQIAFQHTLQLTVPIP